MGVNTEGHRGATAGVPTEYASAKAGGGHPWGFDALDVVDTLAPWKNLDSILKSRDITLPTKVHLVKAMVFPVVMYGCESRTISKESRAPKNWCFWTVVLEKTLESPLDCKEIQLVSLK